ncbi:MAG TPA: transcriptional regulator NrdR [Patescibacteria group bacterium]|nr:transcriptional regulator NrdR [Patescibacteria group bacterium]
MKCPNCDETDTKVLDSRPIEDDSVIRRRRMCEKCDFRFTTKEEMEILGLVVLKRGGGKQAYDRSKLERGVRLAFEKLEYDEDTLRELVHKVEQEVLRKSRDGEVKSSKIGEVIMKILKEKDKVAYIRFASVYRQFGSIEEFKNEISKL